MSKYNVSEISEEIKQEFEDLISEFQPFKIAPFQLVSGAYDVVNGAIQQNPDINDETQYEKVFTGQNSTILIWRDSTKLVLKDPEEEPQGPNGNYLPTQFKRDYNVGKLYDFYLDTETLALASDSGTASTISTLTGFIRGNVEDKNIFDAYVIPRVGNYVYKFEIGTKYRTKDGEVIYTETSLTKINKIATTDDITQIFQLTNSLGEGYAWPKSVIDEDGKETIELDPDRLQDDPVKYIQLEAEDPEVVMNFYHYGREATYGDGRDKDFKEPTILLPIDFQSTDGNKLSGQIAPSDYYVYSNDLNVSIDTYYSSWNEKVLTKYSPESIRQYEGHITDGKKETTLATNNQVGESYGTTYWNGWTMNTSDKTVNVLSPFAEDSFTYEATTTYTMDELNAANVFRHQHIQKLPMSSSETTPRVATEIPVLGILGKILFVGTETGWYNTDIARNRVGEVGGFINKDYYTLLATTEFNENQNINAMPFDVFGEDRPETIMGIGTMPTIFKYGLTNKFVEKLEPEIILDINLLGKDIDENGEPPYLWAVGKTVPVIDNDISGYAIDSTIIQAVGKTTYRLTAYNNDNEAIYSVRYESSSKRTGDTRDITTIFNTSAWTFEELVEAPEVVSPQPPDTPDIITWEPTGNEGIVEIMSDNGTDKEKSFDLETIFQTIESGFILSDYNKISLEFIVIGSMGDMSIDRKVIGGDKKTFYELFPSGKIWKFSNLSTNILQQTKLWEHTREVDIGGIGNKFNIETSCKVVYNNVTGELKFNSINDIDGDVDGSLYGTTINQTFDDRDGQSLYINKITFSK